jgi:hypothetical protein
MKGGVKTGDLGEVGAAFQEEPDGRQVVRLVERDERDQPLKGGQHLRVDPHRLRVIQPPVDDAMADT